MRQGSRVTGGTCKGRVEKEQRARPLLLYQSHFLLLKSNVIVTALPNIRLSRDGSYLQPMCADRQITRKRWVFQRLRLR